MGFSINNFSTEMSVLLLSIVLGLLHLGGFALVSDFERGLKWAFGNRDESKPISQIGARLERAFRNYMETFPFMAVILIFVEINHKNSELTAACSIIWLVARVLYFPAYAMGSWLRSWLWIIAMSAISVLGIYLFV